MKIALLSKNKRRTGFGICAAVIVHLISFPYFRITNGHYLFYVSKVKVIAKGITKGKTEIIFHNRDILSRNWIDFITNGTVCQAKMNKNNLEIANSALHDRVFETEPK